jgi:exosortase D (VPLPA-CTERM-specific)
VLMNSLRVGVIGVLVEHWGVGMAEGFLHDFQGWAVFMLSAGLLIALTAGLNRIGSERGNWRQLFGLEFPHATPVGAAVRARSVPRAFLAATALVGALAAANAMLATHSEIVPQRQSFATYPLDLREWQGTRRSIAGEFLDALQLDDYVLADYRRADGGYVNFYVAYYQTQRDRRTAHSPRSCIPAGGWQVSESSQVTLPGTTLRANRMVITNGDARELVYYWFDQRGRNVTNEYAVKWWLFWDAIAKRRTDGALVRLITSLSPHETVAAAEARLTAFAALAVPTLPAYVPR